MPFTPSPGNPKIVSTPQSISLVTNRSATVLDITTPHILERSVWSVLFCCLLNEHLCAKKRAKQHDFSNAGFNYTSAMPDLFLEVSFRVLVCYKLGSRGYSVALARRSSLLNHSGSRSLAAK